MPRFNRQQVRLLIAQGRMAINGQVVKDPRHDVSEFSRIAVDNEVLQVGRPARYYMLHKPMGCVSATQDPEHRTVLDLLDVPAQAGLHIAGRLDYNTTGLMLITDDGLWSRRLTQPTTRLRKRYYVETEQPIEPHYAEVFRQGLYFAYEDLVTLPAELEVLSRHSACLTLLEGRYHQVKRMFGYFQNKVLRLHRLSMGPLYLDEHLAPGEFRELTAEEIQRI